MVARFDRKDAFGQGRPRWNTLVMKILQQHDAGKSGHRIPVPAKAPAEHNVPPGQKPAQPAREHGPAVVTPPAHD